MNRGLFLNSFTLLGTVLILALVAGSGATASPQGNELSSAVVGPIRERRVMFDEDIAWATSREATDRIVERVVSAGFNVYIPCVWHGRGAHFATKFAHIEPRIASRIASGDDPLGYLLERAHSRGLEVHPWFTVMLRLDNRYPAYFAPETPVDSYDVQNAGFRRFIVNLMVDMVKRYPVDGVNLDYVRSVGFCECRQCVADYGRKFGRSLPFDAAAARRGEVLKTVETWNGEAVSEIVREFSTRAKALRKGLVVSIDGHPLSRDLIRQGQDCLLWEENGWTDVIYSMDYRPEPDRKSADRARAALRDPEALTLLQSIFDLVPRERVKVTDRPRIAEYVGDRAVVSREPGTLTGYVRSSRRHWPGSGVAFYHFRQLTDAHIRELRSTVFRETALPSWPRTVKRDGKS